ncbi:MAG: HAMP domain-containing protein [Candidatus Aminicenantes bacterium]|nr:HAMP domain-containing protein [Candidatus Aminicenantes bacterium]
MAWTTLLLVVLVMAILRLVEQREIAVITEESRAKAVLIARNLADRNLQLLFAWDIEGILRNIESQVDDNLLYAVFYDRYATPIAYNAGVADRAEIYGPSRLAGEVGSESAFARAQEVWLGGRVRLVLEVEVPIFAEGTTLKWGSVKVGLSLEDVQSAIRRTRLALILIGLGGFLLGLAGATVLARRIARPLQRLVEGTVRIAKGDFAHRIPVDSGDEIGDLARSFNAMTEKLLSAREQMAEAQRRLVQSEKLAQIGRMTATIAHEIRNPLTSVKLNIQKVAADRELSPTEREHVLLCQEGIARIEKFIKELLDFTRTTELQKARFSIEQIFDESVKQLRDLFVEKGIAVAKNVPPGLPEVEVDGDRMRQVFLNLLRNAAEAVGERGRVALRVSEETAGGRRSLRVLLSDDGPGIPKKDWETVFEPFYTTKPWGFGLGLANARKLIELHRGTIRIVPQAGPGAAFEIEIPVEGET